MKRITFFALLLSCLLSLTAFAAEDVVFIKNDSVTYATLAEAAEALPSTGGTIVVNAAVNHPTASGVTMPAKPVTVTSVYDGVDYAQTNGAYFGVGRTFSLGADLTFENITIKQTHTSGTYGNIYAKGFHLTIGEGVTTVKNATSGIYTQLYGGSADNSFGSPTHLTVKSGTWDRIYGGSYNKQTKAAVLEIMGGTITYAYGGNRQGAFTGGTTTVIMSGGTVTNLFGGNRSTAFTGDTSVTVNGGTVTNLFGGSAAGACNANTVVTVNGGKVTYAYGGSEADTFAGSTVVNMNSDVSYIYGGSYKAATNVSTATINKSAGSGLVLYGGCREAAFTGNTSINMTGGTVTHAIAGGSGPSGGNFTGDTDVNVIGGTVKYVSGYGIFGGSIGASGKTSVHTGEISVNIGGDADIYTSVFGASYYSGVTTVGDINVTVGGDAIMHRHLYGAGYYGTFTTPGTVTVTIKDNASFSIDNASVYLCGGMNTGTYLGNIVFNVQDNAEIGGNVYAGGYFGDVDGNVTVNVLGGTVTATVSAGSREGAINGNATVNALGGSIGHHAGGNYGISLKGGSEKATVSGVYTVLLDGADVAGAIDTATDNSVVTLKSGKVGTVAQKATIDLTGGKTLAVGGDVTASALVGGGELTIPAAGSIIADSFTGEVALVIEGTPVVFKPYVTIKDIATEGAISYNSDSGYEVVKKVLDDAVTYAVALPGMYETTKVTIAYYNPDENGEQPDLVVYKGASSSDSKEKIADLKDGATYEADLAPGLYYWKVYYNGGTDYRLKHFLIEGDKEAISFDIPFEPYEENGYMENVTAETTDQVLEAFFSTNGLVGFNGFDTPTFTEKYLNTRKFMTNEDLCAYVENLDADCDYLYAFFAELEDETNLFPILVFTKDEIPEDATLEEVAEIVRAGGLREIISISGGIHGNEPAGEEGVLNFAKQLSGDYGEELLAKEHIGALVLMPATSPDNLMRFKRTYEDGENPNRDTTSMRHGNTQMFAHVYDLFMPTVHFDCHEDTSGTNTIDASDNSYSNIDDVVFASSSLPNSPIQDMRGVIAGEVEFLNQDMYALTGEMIEATHEYGVRSGYYQWSYYGPGQAQAHAIMRGSYGYLIEVMRIWTGKSHYTRAVFAMQSALMSGCDIIAAQNGEVAQKVAVSRVAAAIENFDEDNVFVLKMASGKSGITFTYNHPSVYADGTYKDENATVTRSCFDTPVTTRPMATGYVLDANASNVSGVLEKLDQAGIEYVKLPAGTTLALRKYTSISNNAAYGEAEEVTFEDGAYAVHTNCSDAYFIAYYFEPDSYIAEDTIVSLYQNGLIADTDNLYRSEEDDFYSVVSGFSTVENDFNGDGEFNVADVLAVLNMLANDKYALEADFNSDGQLTLIDALRVLKILAAF